MEGLEIHSASGLVYTGKGVLAGLVITCSSTTAALATIYDNTAGSGTKVFEAYVAAPQPVIILFPDRLAPRFDTGLYISLAANLTATLWTRQL